MMSMMKALSLNHPRNSSVLDSFQAKETRTKAVERIFKKHLESKLRDPGCAKLYKLANGESFKQCCLAYAQKKDEYQDSLKHPRASKAKLHDYIQAKQEMDSLMSKLRSFLDDPKALEQFMKDCSIPTRIAARAVCTWFAPQIEALKGIAPPMLDELSSL